MLHFESGNVGQAVWGVKKMLLTAKTASRIYRLKTARGCVKESKNYKGETTHDESWTDV
jgi:hypothetical protein